MPLKEHPGRYVVCHQTLSGMRAAWSHSFVAFFLEVTALGVRRQYLYRDGPSHGQIAHLKAVSVFFLCLLKIWRSVWKLIRSSQRYCHLVLIIYCLTGKIYWRSSTPVHPLGIKKAECKLLILYSYSLVCVMKQMLFLGLLKIKIHDNVI